LTVLTLPKEIKAGGQSYGLHPERAVNPSDDGFRKWGAQSIDYLTKEMLRPLITAAGYTLPESDECGIVAHHSLSLWSDAEKSQAMSKATPALSPPLGPPSPFPRPPRLAALPRLDPGPSRPSLAEGRR